MFNHREESSCCIAQIQRVFKTASRTFIHWAITKYYIKNCPTATRNKFLVMVTHVRLFINTSVCHVIGLSVRYLITFSCYSYNQHYTHHLTLLAHREYCSHRLLSLSWVDFSFSISQSKTTHSLHWFLDKNCTPVC